VLTIGLKKMVASRLIVAFPLILSTIIINFTIVHLAPGSPVDYMLSGAISGLPGGIPPGYLEAMKAKFGLDKPLHEQLVLYIVNVLKGDLGFSFVYNRPVIQVITEALPATLLLTISGFVVGVCLGLITGVKSSERPYSLTDNVVTTSSLWLWSVPIFWLGMMMLLLFSFQLNLFPAQGMSDPGVKGFEYYLSVASHLFLPVATLGVAQFALYTRFTRASMLEILSKDYITTARSKGCSRRAIYYYHALRNALLPIVTVLGLRVPHLLMGSVLVETVFAWPGLGRLLFESISRRDYPIIQGIFLIFSIITIVANLLMDVTYGYLDPRIRYK